MKQINISTPKHPNIFAVVDDEDFDWLNQWRWKVSYHPRKVSRYAQRREERNGRAKWIRMHREILRVPAGLLVDHRDGNGLNNTRANLRVATLTENNRNVGKPKHGVTSRFKGVNRRTDRNIFQVQIKVCGKKIHIGYFANEEDAAWAYDRAARAYHGPFARCNFPPPPMLFPKSILPSPASGTAGTQRAEP